MGILVLVYFLVPLVGVIVLLSILPVWPPEKVRRATGVELALNAHGQIKWNSFVPIASKSALSRQLVAEFIARQLFAIEGVEYSAQEVNARIGASATPDDIRFILSEGFKPIDYESGKNAAKVRYTQEQYESALRGSIRHLREKKGKNQ